MRYEINFIEIGNDENHIHFLVQIMKSITAREIFLKHKEVKKLLWGGNLRTSRFYANTVGQFTNEETIKKYAKNQGKVYNRAYSGQLELDL